MWDEIRPVHTKDNNRSYSNNKQWHPQHSYNDNDTENSFYIVKIAFRMTFFFPGNER